MLDYLHQHGGVQPSQALIAVGQCGLEDLQPGALRLRHGVEVQVTRGEPQRPGRDVGGDDPLDVALGEQVLDQRARTATEVARRCAPRWRG